MSQESREIKVTDKRMFKADGELREEYRFLDEKSTPDAAAAPPGAASSTATSPDGTTGPAAPPPRRAEPPRRESPPPASAAPPDPPEIASRVEIPGSPPGLGPTFFDLVAMLAEPVSIYLGDLELPDGQTAENLEMARLHIDLLDVLRQKTAGNLSAQETAFMEDLLYRLRVRYVQKRG